MKRTLSALLARLVLIVFLINADSKSSAAELPSEITIEDALRILQTESPRWAAERAQLGLTEAELIQSALFGNPSLTYNVLQLVNGANTGAATTHQLTIEQPVPLFGQRGARMDAAKATQATARADLAARFTERARELHHAFVDLLGAQEKQRLLTDSLRDIRRAEEIVRGRAAAGDRSKYDVLRVSLEARALDSELAIADAQRIDAAGRIGELLGKPGWQPKARGDLTPIDQAQTAALLWEHARTAHPVVIAAQKRIEQTHAFLTQAKRERFPEVSLQLGFMITQAESSASVLAGIATPLPLWNRQQGVIARVRAAQIVAEQEHRAILSETESAIARTIAVSHRRHSAAARLATEVFARLPELRSMAEESYRQGRSGIVDLLDAFRSLKELRQQYVEGIVAAEHAEVDLLYAAGITGSGMH
jgi:cobalt-zinc-cadmium efflux system outer membrane protein